MKEIKAAWYNRTDAKEWGTWSGSLTTFQKAQEHYAGRARLLLSFEDRQVKLYVAPVPIRSSDEVCCAASLSNRDKAFASLSDWLAGYTVGTGLGDRYE